MQNQELCPCRSGNPYATCCQPFHEGRLPQKAMELMRSRYSAYALCLPEYIIATTHPKNPHFYHDQNLWKKNIIEFCHATKFLGLEILDEWQKNGKALVTFFAQLQQQENDVSFTERSSFLREDGKWLYFQGEVSDGRDVGLINFENL